MHRPQHRAARPRDAYNLAVITTLTVIIATCLLTAAHWRQ